MATPTYSDDQVRAAINEYAGNVSNIDTHQGNRNFGVQTYLYGTGDTPAISREQASRALGDDWATAIDNVYGKISTPDPLMPPGPGLPNNPKPPDPAPIRATLAPTPTYTPTPPIAAPTYEIDPNTMTVEGRLAGLLDPSNPLMQRAATQGMQYANSRGLLNSSIGAEAAQNAMIDQGIKIAGPDAETYFKQQGLNQDYTFRYDELGEKTREFDVGADQWQQGFNEDVRQFGLNFDEKTREFDVGSDQWQKNFDEGVRQYGQDFNERTRQFNVGSQQWQKNFDEGVRQYGQDFMENVRKFDEGIREYDNNFDENSRQFDDNLQWLRDKSGEDLTFRYDEMDNDNKKAFIGTVGDARNKFDDYVAALMLNPDLSADDIQGLTDTAFTSLQSYIDLSAAYLGADISWAPNDDVETDTPAVPLTQDNYVEVAQGFAAKGWAIDDITRYFKESGVTKQQALAAFGNDPPSVASVNSVYGEDGLLEPDVTTDITPDAPDATNITDDPAAYALAQLNAGVPTADIISTMKDAGVSYATMHNYPGASQEWKAAVNSWFGVDDVTTEPPPISDTRSAYDKALDKDIREMIAKYPAFDWDHLPSGEQILQYSRGKYDAGRGGSAIPIVGASGTW